MNHFITSTLLWIGALGAAFVWAGWPAVLTCFLLTLMEVSFSFDNAVVNATVLKHMDTKWQNRFLTWGMLVAVFGMRFLFPILVVAFATGLSVADVTGLALHHPAEYTNHVLASHVQIGAFGGMFLLMVFLHFILDEHKKIHWIEMIESKLVQLGKLEAIEVVVALIVLLIADACLDADQQLHALMAGIVGIILYVLVSGISALISQPAGAVRGKIYSGMAGFIYLQFLDASFSLDGVIGAFAISKDIVIIMLGLGAGAMYVRSLTVSLVRQGTLDKYKYLEHGAHYGIGVLAVIMLITISHPVPEMITGLVGVVFIGLALFSSVRLNRKRRVVTPH